MRNTAPPPSAAPADSRPLCLEMTRWLNERPIPWPSFRVVIEWVEDLAEEVPGHARAVVDDPDHHLLPLLRHAYPEKLLTVDGRHRLERVRDEVKDRLLQERGVRPAVHRFGRKFLHELDLALTDAGRRKDEGLADDPTTSTRSIRGGIGLEYSMIRLTTAPILSEAAFAWTTTAWSFSFSSGSIPSARRQSRSSVEMLMLIPERGFRISWAIPAASWPREASFSRAVTICSRSFMRVMSTMLTSAAAFPRNSIGTVRHCTQRNTLCPVSTFGHGEPELHPLQERLPLLHRTAKPLELRDVLRVGRPQPSKIEPLGDRTHKTLLFRVPEDDAAFLNDHGAEELVLDQGPEPVLALPKQIARPTPLLLHPDPLGELPLEPDVHNPKLFRPLGHAGLQLIPGNADLLFAPFEIPEQQIIGTDEAVAMIAL